MTSPSSLPRPSMLLRAVALGVASASRSTAGVTAVAATSTPADRGVLARRLGSRVGTVLTALVSAGELVGDKLPGTPARTGLPGLLPRVAAGAVSAGTVAVRDGDEPVVPVAVGLVTAVGASFLLVRLRGLAADRFGSDRPGALAEDGLAALLGWLGARRPQPSVETGEALRR